MSYSLNKLYRAAGVSRQGVWDHFRREQAELQTIRKVMGQVDKRREAHPGEGLEKLYWQLLPEEMGRDKFCRIFGQLGYGLRRPKKSVRTTIPSHKVFKNVVEGRVISGPCQVWQSDITYIKVGDRFYYLVFIIDVYTRRIVGWAASKTLRADANIKALNMALSRFGADRLQGCVHHSDRGSQYTDSRYLKLLRGHGLTISMGRKATDNAFAERINGVIKNEYLIPWAPTSFRQLSRLTRKAARDYNTQRHHGALERHSPIAYEQEYWQLPKDKRKAEVIRSERTPKFLEGTLQKIPVDTPKQTPYCVIPTN